MKKSKSVDSHKLAELFKYQPPNSWSPIIGVVPAGGPSRGDIVLVVGTIAIIAMLIGSIFVLLK